MAPTAHGERCCKPVAARFRHRRADHEEPKARPRADRADEERSEEGEEGDDRCLLRDPVGAPRYSGVGGNLMDISPYETAEPASALNYRIVGERMKLNAAWNCSGIPSHDSRVPLIAFSPSLSGARRCRAE